MPVQGRVLQENSRADHGAIGSPDEPGRMCVSVPLGSIDESMSAVSEIVDDPNKIKTRAENQMRFYELATKQNTLPGGEPAECLVNEELLLRSACIYVSQVRNKNHKP